MPKPFVEVPIKWENKQGDNKKGGKKGGSGGNKK
jgi:hypothetical protein